MKPLIQEDDEVADIPTMHAMSDEGYANYLAKDLFWVDHHDILRSTVGEYPIATTPRQIELMITYLHTVSARMRASRD